jgi:methylated-DNA-[protein]-cysteine S-methyltransferase
MKISMIDLFVDKIASPIGTILFITDGEKLCALDYADCESRMQKLLQARYGQVRLKEAPNACGFSDALRAYLAGDLTGIDQIAVCPGGTPFQQQVWSALRTIPPGTVTTYGELAKRVGRPSAYRAVGMANAVNPIAIVIPCHRLVGADGTLTGYAGGLERKRWLLEHESVKFDGEKVKIL